MLPTFVLLVRSPAFIMFVCEAASAYDIVAIAASNRVNTHVPWGSTINDWTRGTGDTPVPVPPDSIPIHPELNVF